MATKRKYDEEKVGCAVFKVLQDAEESGALEDNMFDQHQAFRIEPGYDPGTFSVHTSDGGVFAVEVMRVK